MIKRRALRSWVTSVILIREDQCIETCSIWDESLKQFVWTAALRRVIRESQNVEQLQTLCTLLLDSNSLPINNFAVAIWTVQFGLRQHSSQKTISVVYEQWQSCCQTLTFIVSAFISPTIMSAFNQRTISVTFCSSVEQNEMNEVHQNLIMQLSTLHRKMD